MSDETKTAKSLTLAEAKGAVGKIRTALVTINQELATLAAGAPSVRVRFREVSKPPVSGGPACPQVDVRATLPPEEI